MAYNAGDPEDVKRSEKKHEYEQTEEMLTLRNLLKTPDGGLYISTLLKNSMIFENCMSKGNSMGIFNEGWRNFGLSILKGVIEAVPEDVPWWMKDMARHQLGVKFPGDPEDG